MNLNDEQGMAALAAALAYAPGATLQEIATAVGVSRATLYRFCSSREKLVHRLLKHAVTRLAESLQAAKLDEGSPAEALERLLIGEFEHRELHAFMMEFWSKEIEVDTELAPACNAYEKALDAFFLRGQREGFFRIDIPAAVLNENLTWLLIGLMDAERRGRIARTSVLQTARALFFEGAAQR
ncbi:TetR/AcrR family transcriptional regulator [Comamonas thiooxydans]|uniref:TetR/AcrR family transcriptional regulator n=1 Tax=Comamonas thiooxydans TaxID=363952 RepID=A0AA42Q0G8_9BURK|nr:TetR/AcrR family transcriptional regulator [Comamonas thiooxydans]MDH1334617.1 TetR/AcrR family transcriptional regulator [Comamonas thiooxydans]MDH1740938.1 TetR/AcrR family transcriptional regulator [Comamonas thiooxydans]MDH1787131.1 TetR/AcrR family transcriptional regulator [Comamonas thiooxydans]